MSSYWTDNTQVTEDGTVVPIPDPTLASTDMSGTIDTRTYAGKAITEYVNEMVEQATVPREDLPPEQGGSGT